TGVQTCALPILTLRTQRCLRVIAMLTLAVLPIAGLQAAVDQDIEVRVKKNGPEVAVDVDCPVNASIAVAWEVLTDYDHMSEFLSDVQHSSVQARDGHTLQVYQKGKARGEWPRTLSESYHKANLPPLTKFPPPPI